MNRIVKSIPNTITCMNLFAGCIATSFAFKGYLEGAFVMILIAAVFDFLDGFAARLLKAYSPIGKDLDSLADMISFGMAPSAVLYAMGGGYFAFAIAAFSALRLAKFNNDTRQTSEFIGLPTPANALFFASIGFITAYYPESSMTVILSNYWLQASLIVIFSFLMVSEIRMFSLKFKSYAFSQNKLVYLFIVLTIASIAIFEIKAMPFIIIGYVLVSCVRNAACSR